ncbi:hypothetical protein [Peribacillus glennii]|uniref:Uncharacterized protein n=1 Tax=Peribacillus glennii TaxID=2303991 RepID=A0A372L6P5_9BACI|nr:hypothetical protein [Peribacillus glennii]RFU60772.1 hypothetical protein D0466_20695 [Peribacillus glennii]
MTVKDHEMVEVWKISEYLVKQGQNGGFQRDDGKEGWHLGKRRETANALVCKKGNVTTSVSYRHCTRYCTIIFFVNER